MSELSPRTITQLQAIARKLRDDPEYMAWILAAYQKLENLTDTQLRNKLGTNEHMLARLSLCKRPLPNSPDFQVQINQIVEYSNIDKLTLVNIIRLVDALTAFSSQGSVEDQEAASTHHLTAQRGLLAATRDKSDSETSQSENPEDDCEGRNDE